MQGWSAAIGFLLARHGVVLFGWLFALAALSFHFFVNRRRNVVIDGAVIVLFAMLLTTLCDFRLVGDDLEYATIARNLTSGYGLVDASDTVYPLRIAYTLLYSGVYALG